MINSIQDLQALVLRGENDWKRYGDVNARYSDDGRLVIFNYTNKAQYARRWNWFEANSRGIIIDTRTGEVVALPFPKFYNWLEDGRTTTAPISYITEKLDGSLGVLYRLDGQYRIATRGSLDGVQTIWATEFLNRSFNLQALENEYTLLFEIIYPENRVVVNYGDREELILIGARNRFTGDLLSLETLTLLGSRFGFNLPRTYDFSSVDDIIAATTNLTIENEGWVVTFSDGSMYKFKGDTYRLAQRMLTGVSFGQVLEAISRGTFEQIIEDVPDEFLVQIREYERTITDKVAEITARVEQIMLEAPRTSRRDFAMWVQQNFNGKIHTSYLFAAYDEHPLAPLVYKHEF